MPTRFVEPDTKILLDSIRQLMTQLAAYNGDAIGKTHPLVGCAWWSGTQAWRRRTFTRLAAWSGRSTAYGV